MLILVKSKISKRDLKKASEDLGEYIKFVVDLEKEILTVGGARHVQGEEFLLKEGSKQKNLWGGGLDLQTGEIDCDSMINIRPNDNNPSREILSSDLRDKITKLVRRLLT